jgi:DNA processing protein
VLGVQTLGPIMSCAGAADAAPPAPGAGRRTAEGAIPEAERSRRIGQGPDERRYAAADHPDARSDGTGAPDDRTGAASERDAWVVLLSVSGLGPVSFGALLAAFGSARAALEAANEPNGAVRLQEALADASSDQSQLETVFDACIPAEPVQVGAAGPAGDASSRRRPVIGPDLAARICEAAVDGGRRVERVRSLGLTVVTLDEPTYPARLRQVELPPPLLFVRGSTAALSATSAVAVVGTRRPTDKGRLIAGWIGSAIARTGAVVVSGLALGIDGAAHAAVVAEGRPTVAVLGGGHARLFPVAHERLAAAIIEAGGAIVSELAPDTSPSRGTFPRRNRLVSGLSDATVVVEAGRRSGALITAGWALEQGRECFLVPGPFDSPTSAGCHAFLRSFPGQARLVSGVAELIEDLGLENGAWAVSADREPRERGSQRSGPGRPSSSACGAGREAVLAVLAPAERALAEELSRGPATADQLAARTSLPGAAVLSALTLLELRGLTTCGYGRYTPAGALAGWLGRSTGSRTGAARAGPGRALGSP